MNSINEIRYCKGKNCGISLPADYKYKYCEKCRNIRKDNVKEALKVGGIILGIVVAVITAGKTSSDD